MKILISLLGCFIFSIQIVGCQVGTNSALKNKKPAETIDKNQKVFLITLDGLRWQELFGGADSLLIDSKYTKKPKYIKELFWAKTKKERREKLMPFFWNTIAKEGQIYGNRIFENKVNVANTHWFSYPGYSEILTGVTDNERINSNDKINNPNITILEALNNTDRYKGKVGAFGSWDVFPFIINEERSGLYINAGYRKAKGNNLTDREIYLNHLQDQAIQPWTTVRQDVFTHNYAFEFIKKEKPEFVFISYGETDDFAHDGDYQHYLLAAKNTDKMIQELWEYCQQDEFYKDNTIFIITTDHGRGTQPLEEWKSHGQGLKYHGKIYNIKGSDETWLAIIGNNIKAKGEMKHAIQLYNSQIAITIQSLFGINSLKNQDKINRTELPIFE